jgi:hypothetical protein
MQGLMGSDPQNPDVLCTQTATDRLVSFWYSIMCFSINLVMHLYLILFASRLRMSRRWFNAMDRSTIGGAGRAAYASAGGQAHGRWDYLIWISKLSSYACDSTESMIYYTKSCRLGIFYSTIDSRELRCRGRQSTSSSSQSSRSRSSAQEIELAVLRQQAEYHQSVLREQLEHQRQQAEYQRQQAKYQKKKDEYYANLQAHNQALLSVS